AASSIVEHAPPCQCTGYRSKEQLRMSNLHAVLTERFANPSVVSCGQTEEPRIVNPILLTHVFECYVLRLIWILDIDSKSRRHELQLWAAAFEVPSAVDGIRSASLAGIASLAIFVISTDLKCAKPDVSFG